MRLRLTRHASQEDRLEACPTAPHPAVAINPPASCLVAGQDDFSGWSHRTAPGLEGNGHPFRGVDMNDRGELNTQAPGSVRRQEARADGCLELRVDEPKLVA